MRCEIVSIDGVKYVFVTGGQVSEEQDALEILSACYEHETTLVMLPSECLSEGFLDLSTKIAGLFLQKLTNYGIKTAAVIDTERLSERFRDFSYESAKGKVFRIFNSIAEAEDWLITD